MTIAISPRICGALLVTVREIVDGLTVSTNPGARVIRLRLADIGTSVSRGIAAKRFSVSDAVSGTTPNRRLGANVSAARTAASGVAVTESVTDGSKVWSAND